MHTCCLSLFDTTQLDSLTRADKKGTENAMWHMVETRKPAPVPKTCDQCRFSDHQAIQTICASSVLLGLWLEPAAVHLCNFATLVRIVLHIVAVTEAGMPCQTAQKQWTRMLQHYETVCNQRIEGPAAKFAVENCTAEDNVSQQLNGHVHVGTIFEQKSNTVSAPT